MRTISIPAYILQHWNATPTDALAKQNALAYKKLLKGAPDVSVVIPAYNEEKNILQTLASLCNNETAFSAEIIIVNNNSKDATEALALASGVTCILETKQGITAARNAGLAKAQGKIVLNADADTIYPKDWIEQMARPLTNSSNAVTYGRFSFIPIGATGRITYFFYEYLTDWVRYFKKYTKDEAVNVFGFNSGFRRADGLTVNGFEHPPGTNEDGWLALKLRDKGFGKLYCVTNSKALVWTSDRRIQMDGGFFNGTITRIKRVLFKQAVERNDL